MSEYRAVLHFLHAITDARKRVSVFLFVTRLTNVTRALRGGIPTRRWQAAEDGGGLGRRHGRMPAAPSPSTVFDRLPALVGIRARSARSTW